jgi:hypothetical protein
VTGRNKHFARHFFAKAQRIPPASIPNPSYTSFFFIRATARPASFDKLAPTGYATDTEKFTVRAGDKTVKVRLVKDSKHELLQDFNAENMPLDDETESPGGGSQ